MHLVLHYDFCCPWCFVGLRHLARVLEGPISARAPTLEWCPYRLVRNLPREGVPARTRYLELTQGDRDRAAAMMRRAEVAGADLEIKFDFDAALVVETTEAHRLVLAAPAEERLRLADALFRAMWSDGRNINDYNVLTEIGAEHGLGDAAQVRRFLGSGALRDVVVTSYNRSETAPLLTIPYLLVDGVYQIQAAHLPGVIEATLATWLVS